MFARPDGGDRVVLVHIDFPSGGQPDLDEFIILANSAGIISVAIIKTSRQLPDSKYFIGSGKVNEILQSIQAYDAECVIFNHALSPSQQRNLENKFNIRVLDRTQLILDIFAQRARTHEGKLQVELAQLQHLSTRLVRGWSHLERQKGGIGLRGPGETQLETDRRLLRGRIKHIKKRLHKVRKQRQQGRQKRERKPVPTVALVGYTNAGKSTLFNALTDSDNYVADQLFATLDPTLRRLSIAELGDVVLIDTVGFIRHLPHDLVDAFRATLEETQSADLLLHIVDASDGQCQQTVNAVDDVLQEIGADQIPQLKIFNKIDLMPAMEPHYDNNVWVSASEKQGLELIKQAIKHKLDVQFIEKTLTLSLQQANIRAKLYELKAVISENFDEHGHWQMRIRLPELEWKRLRF